MFRLIVMLLPALEVAAGTIGVVDTIGGTTYDWQFSGPALRMLVSSPGHGIHATWMYSYSTSGTYFPDRNMRYNFHGNDSSAWNWIDSDFMLSGASVFTERAGYGNMDVDTNGVAVISAHHSTGSGASDIAPIVACDADVGSGVFDYSHGEPTIDHYEWPCVGVNMNGYYQLAMIDATSQDSLFWSCATAWQNWDTAMSIPPPEPEPQFPSHNIATSKVSGSNKVCITWVAASGLGYQQEPGFYRESPDGGDNWNSPVRLEYPPAFSPGSDTLPSFSITSLFPFHDKHDRLHIVGDVHAFVNDTNYLAPSEVWHFCLDNSPQWTRIHRAGAYNPSNPNPTYACRPSIGEDEGGGLYVAWEQFDSTNIEPGPPACARADIFYAQDNGDNGASWNPGMRITEQDTWTCGFPSAIDRFEGDTFRILYLMDQHAGYFLYGEGPATYNPVVVHKVPVTPSSVAGKEQVVAALDLSVWPSPFAGSAAVAYSVPRQGHVKLEVFDFSGRMVARLADGYRPAGRYSTVLSAKGLAPGVYVARLSSVAKCLTRKLVLTE